ncbi:hypothetical protein C5F48_22200 [Cereibacter changlensis JA139]|uniref:Uncharacterized protein n=2 Tax=Cereibacter changlensis TaxID=402884 RepID=A0A2T4JNU0_9RHOB|nr:hypothetical protein C5F48_22200 [Cereibacter changlensis JA139]
MQAKIRAAIYAAWPPGVVMEIKAFEREVGRLLDGIAVAFMALRPDLELVPFLDWLSEHPSRFSRDEWASGLVLRDARFPG